MEINLFGRKLSKGLTSIFLLVWLFSFLFSCNEEHTQSKQDKAVISGVLFGDTVEMQRIVPASGLLSQLAGNSSLLNNKFTITGKVEEVCQKKGCWLTMRLEDGTFMRMHFYDYGFFVPKDIVGDSIFAFGSLSKDTVSVEELRHYAMDGGASKEAADSIQAPEVSFSFEAYGVFLKK